MALNDFQNVISFHLPKGKLWGFLQCTKFIITNIIASQPISNAPTYFIDGNKKGITGIVGPDIKEKLPTTYCSIQKVELYALYALLSFQPLSFNVYTDSKYLASLFPDFVTAFLYNLDEELYTLFSQTQALIRSCTEPFFIAHICAHSGLPGPLVAGNDAFDRLIAPIFTYANDERANLHTNANRLHSKYHIPLTEARHIIKTYDVCAPLHLQTTISGVIPQSQQPNSLWQSDFTQCSLGKFSLLFVSIDTFFQLYLGNTCLFRIQQTLHFHTLTHLPHYGDSFSPENRQWTCIYLALISFIFIGMELHTHYRNTL